jgi:hypothetical protein
LLEPSSLLSPSIGFKSGNSSSPSSAELSLSSGGGTFLAVPLLLIRFIVARCCGNAPLHVRGQQIELVFCSQGREETERACARKRCREALLLPQSSFGAILTRIQHKRNVGIGSATVCRVHSHGHATKRRIPVFESYKEI